MKLYLLVNGNFVQTSGMDMPNLALATFLADRGDEVHLVTHSADEGLAKRPNVTVHYVPKPAQSYLLAAPLFDHIGRHWASKIASRGGSVVVNGGNCLWNDVNWVHYVHASFRAQRAGGVLRVLKNEVARRTFASYERRVLKKARIVIANSELTRRDLVKRLGVDSSRVHKVYYGIDADKFRPPSVAESINAKKYLGWNDKQPVVAFIGSLGDRRKGFDRLFTAWRLLCADETWDANLAVIGTGVELSVWKSRTNEAGLQSRINFLGFREDVPSILYACDALIAPTRYEAYGQGVHEALCCGLPALVTRTAGVAERFPLSLQDLLIPDPEDVDDLVARLRTWHERREEFCNGVANLSKELRERSWQDMAAEIVDVIERDGNVTV